MKGSKKRENSSQYSGQTADEGKPAEAAVEALLLVYREALYLLTLSQIEQHQEYMRIKWLCAATWKWFVMLVACTTAYWAFGSSWS